MSDACDCDQSTKNNKSKWNKKFQFVKKKKKKPDVQSTSHLKEISNCPICAQKRMQLLSEQCMVDVYDEKQRIRAEAIREDPDYSENNPERSAKPDCDCTRCRRARGEDPLTVELLPMEAQVTLQNSLQDTILMCAIL